MTDRAAPRTEAGKRLAKLLARDYDEDFLSPDWTHPSEMILAIEREAAALVPQQARAAPRTEAAGKLLDELAESPLPGARYARDVVSRRIDAIEREAYEMTLAGLREAAAPQIDVLGEIRRRLMDLGEFGPGAEVDRSDVLDILDDLSPPPVAAVAEDRDRREARLVEALRYQWEMNHSEHCRNEWPHAGRCTWPQPDALLAAPGQAGPTGEPR